MSVELLICEKTVVLSLNLSLSMYFCENMNRNYTITIIGFHNKARCHATRCLLGNPRLCIHQDEASLRRYPKRRTL